MRQEVPAGCCNGQYYSSTLCCEVCGAPPSPETDEQWLQRLEARIESLELAVRKEAP